MLNVCLFNFNFKLQLLFWQYGHSYAIGHIFVFNEDTTCTDHDDSSQYAKELLLNEDVDTVYLYYTCVKLSKRIDAWLDSCYNL